MRLKSNVLAWINKNNPGYHIEHALYPYISLKNFLIFLEF